ncbi:MAG: hypothetical protein CENE_00980 [Candidatus Celerinatantimonas neptuna]|nr:MAG: hypothetical protein CENE_00980 [Candidatus Celerinatantimonas neptuna]
MSYKYLFYSSEANLEVVDIYEILNLARKENPHYGITGFLMAHTGGFYQLIEGPEADVDQLFSNISKDHRHHDVRMISQGYRDTRLFPDWQMGYLRIDSKEISEWHNTKDEAKVLIAFIEMANSCLKL